MGDFTDALGRDIPDDQRLSLTRDALAEALWAHGEDELAHQALSLSDGGLVSVEQLALWHKLNDPPTEAGSAPPDALIIARGGIDYFECATRDPAMMRPRTRPADEDDGADQ